jgi:Tol biopolymer transport system component
LFILVLLAGVYPALAAKSETKPEKDVAEKFNEPRPDARKITFDVDEGTWMNVDVSPDGANVLFDLLGDIYTIPVSGGTAKRITTGPAMDKHPRYSPDGKTILFISDREGMDNLWLMNVDGTNPHSLTKEKDNYFMSPAWTPDGKYVITRKEDGKRAGIPPIELWIYHIQGGTGIKLVSSDDMSNASGPVSSKDGRYIYFGSRKVPFNYIPNLSNGLWQIMRYDRQTGETFQLTGGIGGAVRPALSPDGKLLVFLSRRDNETVLVSRNLSSGAEKIIAHGLSRDEQEGFTRDDLYPNYSFTPDSKAIILWNHGKIQRLDVETKQVADIPFKVTV